MKSFSKDEGGVAFLLLYVIVTLGIGALTYMILSDGIDWIIPVGQQVSTQIGEFAYNDETTWVQDGITFLFKYSIMFVVLIVILFIWTMGQKPERNW